MISEADPFEKLKLLSIYMSMWVDAYPKPIMRFSSFLYKYHSDIIPGTPEFYRRIATHCFYCNVKLAKGANESGNPKRSSVDHYEPKSKGKTTKYVICCASCNTKKWDASPADLIKSITKCVLMGRSMWGFHGEKLQSVAYQIQIITNDMLFNTGPKIYFLKR